MQIQTFAEVLGSEELAKPLRGVGGSGGRPLREYVELSRGTYIYDMPLSPIDRDRLRRSARFIGDDREIREISTTGAVRISLEHLRSHDVDTAVVRVGYLIEYSPDEVDALGLGYDAPS